MMIMVNVYMYILIVSLNVTRLNFSFPEEPTIYSISSILKIYKMKNVFIGDMWPNKDSEEPDWVKTEREQFGSYRDKNGDGKMDSEEVKHWILPPNYDHSEAEAKHLIIESDLNQVCSVISKRVPKERGWG